MRFYRTAVEANISRSTYSSLLCDLVRAICRFIKKNGQPKALRCRNRRRMDRKLLIGVLNAKNAKPRKGLYRKFLRQCQGFYQQVLDIVTRL